MRSDRLKHQNLATPITPTELAQMERMLGGLLKSATPDEQAKILRLHKQLKNLYETQSEDRERLEYLQKLVD